MSKLTSDGFFKLRKCDGIGGERASVQVDGGCDFGGSGGGGDVNDGKVTGMGRDGGGLSFCKSCWPASRPPASAKLYQRLTIQVHGAPRTKRVG